MSLPVTDTHLWGEKKNKFGFLNINKMEENVR